MRFFRASTLAIFLFTALLGTWFVTQGSMDLFETGQHLGAVYDSMAAHLLQGDVGVAKEAIGWEAFYHEGKVRAYFLPAPALYRIVLNTVLPSYYGTWARLSILVALVLTTAWVLATYIELKRWLLPGAAARDARAENLIALTAGLGCTTVYLCAGAYVFHEAIAWASCWTFGTIYFLARHARTARQRYFYVAAVFGVLAFFSRFTVGAGALMLLGLSSLRDKRLRWTAAAVVAGAFFLFTAYNYARFGTFLDSVPIRLAGNYSKERLERIGGSLTNVAALPNNLLAYGLYPRLGLLPEFPWLGAPNDRWLRDAPGLVYDGKEPLASVAASMPIVFVLSILGAAFVALRHKKLLLVLAALAVPALVPLVLVYVSERYLHDAMPLLLTAASLGLLAIERWRTHPAAQAVLWLAALWGVYAMFAITYDWQYRYAWATTPPERMRQLRTISGSLTALADSFRSGGALERMKMAGPAPSGWCRHPEFLYSSFENTLFRCNDHSWHRLQGVLVENSRIQLPEFSARNLPEPLISAGPAGQPDVVFIAYDDSQVRFGLYQAGGVGPMSAGIRAKPGQRMHLVVILDPAGHISVTVDGRAVLNSPLNFQPWDGATVRRGVKPPGGPLASSFTGVFLD